ncbi:MAG TPA: polyprenyl synthetase family protein [Polyangiales bacterium]|jgi:geranylgeranyl diphosphate synthase type I|nr:polyprenyl synthetase family protein [Polyangiales bacterium]
MSETFEQVVQRVNAELATFLDAKREEARRVSPRAIELVDAVAELTMRGGKRLRPVALHAGYRSVCANGEAQCTSAASAALELLQTYFLIQDDWMDSDEERRGGPAVHVVLTRACGDERLGASLAILAGDLAAGYAFELLHRAPFPSARLQEGLAAFSRMHTEVVFGQQLDLLEHDDVALMHHLKTGSYTVRGPLRLGALLGDASAAQLDALDQLGQPLGVAFQLRDDLLGTFGDPQKTGKPAGHDLREGKNTVLVAEARRTLGAADKATLENVLENVEASTDEIAEVRDLLVRSGVRARVEAKLDALVAEASQVLDRAPFEAEGAGMLRALLQRFAQRDR